MQCNNCGSENRDDAKFCRKCGEILVRQEPQSLAHDRQAKNGQPRKHKPRFILIFATFALLFSIAGFITLTIKAKNSPTDGAVRTNVNSAFHYSDELYYDTPDENHFAEDVDTGINYIDNEVVIYCDDGVSIGNVLDDSGVAAFEIVGHAGATGSFQVRLDKAMDYSEVSDLCKTIASAEGVIKCTPNYTFVVEPSEKTSDPAWSEDAEKGKPSKTWGLESIKAPEAWDLVTASKDVHVGMLESSQFYKYHEDLDDAIVETLPSSDEQFDIKDGWGWFTDEDDHGTHVAGIIGAESNSSGSVGVAYGASLYGYSCGGKDSQGNPKITDGYGIEVGLTYLIASCGCDVVNISVQWAGDVQKRASAGNGAEAIAAQWEMQQYSAYYGDFIKALIRGGHDSFIICKSADNDATKGLANWDLFGCIGDDEAASRILVVGSLAEGKDGKLEVSSFSSCGSRVDILAPGSDIYSTIYSTTDEGDASIPYSDYGYMSGTSMATPMASGVAALVKSANPELKGNQIKEIILETVVGSYADKTGISKGQINAEAAVKRAKSVGDEIPRKLATSFHMTYSSKKWPDQAYEEWVNASYDKQGNITHKEITRETSFNGWEGEPAYSLDFEYDAAGDLLHVTGVESPGASYSTQVNWNLGYEEGNATLRASGTEGSDSRYVNDTYDADGNLVTRDYLIRTGQVLENGTLTLSYDTYGRISGQSANKGYNGNQSSMNRYDMGVAYDGSSRIASIEVLDSSGKLFSRRTYEYDDAGRLTGRNHFYDGGSSNLTVKQSYSYDEKGRLSSIDQTEGDGWWAPANATFTTDEDGSIVAACIEGEDYTRTYEVEYVTISTPRGQEPFNAVDLTNPVNPEIYNELWVSHANLDPTPYDESAFLRENRRWLELHDPSEVAQESESESAGDETTHPKVDSTIESTDSVEASTASSEFDGKRYWVVFTEGFRNGRVEASAFNVSSGSPTLVWDESVTVSGATVDGKVSQFRLKEDGEWEKIGEYGIPTDWALEILASNVPIVDSSGNRVDVPETY